MDAQTLKGQGDALHTILALFGPRPNHGALVGLFNLSLDLLSRHGHPPNMVAFRRGEKHGRYQSATQRALNAIQCEDVTGFALDYVSPPSAKPTSNSLLYGGTMRNGFALGGRIDLLSPLPELIVPIVLQVNHLMPITYGFQYVIDQFYGPYFHANGIIYVQPNRKGPPPLPDAEEDRMSAWSNRRERLMPLGHLRDVFPLNFLTAIHRQRTFQGVPLFDWIAQDASRGRLEQIATNLWAWHVPEERCKKLADDFEAGGLLASGDINAEPLPPELQNATLAQHVTSALSHLTSGIENVTRKSPKR